MVITGDVTRIDPAFVTGPATIAPRGPVAAPGGPSFQDVLTDSLAQVTRLQGDADRAITSLGGGSPVSLHETMLALEQADLSFRLMMQVHDKIVEAYQEALRTA